MRKIPTYSKLIIMIFCLGILLPFVNNGLAVTHTSETPDMADMGTSGTPIDDPFEIKDNNPPVLLIPASGDYVMDNTPFFDWSTVSGADLYNIQVDDQSGFTSPRIDMNVGSSACTALVTLADGRWYWRVRSRHWIIIPLWGAFSSSKSFTVDTNPPSAPGLVIPASAVITNDNTVYFDWSYVTGCDFYRLQVDETNSFSSPDIDLSTGSTYYSAAPLSDSIYYWRVQARDYAGNWGAWSVIRYLTIDTAPPGIPDLVSPTDTGTTMDTTPTFDWDPVATAVSYHIQVSLSATFATTVRDYWLAITSYTPSSLADGLYYWRVQARDSAINIGTWSDTWQVTIDTIAPGIPSLITPANGLILNDNTVLLDWSTVSTATLYQVQVDDDPAYSSPSVDSSIATSDLTTQTLIDGQYYWRVRARDAVGNWGTYSASRTFAVDTTSPVISNPGVTPPAPNDDDNAIFHCDVTDEFGVSSVALYYRIDGGSWAGEAMSYSSGDTYEYVMSVLPYGTFVEYYFVAYDNAVTDNSALDDNGGLYYSFTIGSGDVTGPEINNIIYPVNPTDYETITVNCTATDAEGIFYVTIFYRVNGGSWIAINMTFDTGDSYTVNLGSFDYSDDIEFYIMAVDDSPNQNSAFDDNEGEYYYFTVISGDVTGPVIANVTHSQNPTDAVLVNITCTVTDLNGIQTVTLYYRINGGAWIIVAMTLISGDTYDVSIGPFAVGEVVAYFIEATDDSPNHNVVRDKNDGAMYIFTVIGITIETSFYYLLPVLAILSLAVLIRKRK